ncbi:putative peroxidase-related enzyme [Nonomuraea polychroma]|uniref:Putative peroxidase-related enzyme n=1 Tax=Nonomuraea polychroma TaxID=46176 RepID=A0A438M1Z1_9ACTN|nr:carboxymuconolactone decarboxylase family protein [Nonomuraea polychroma]RVX39772.1 putative peroxidase-related enzyme [Nonomuraea polychroma]
MPHIAIQPEMAPGTPGLFQYRPETGRPLAELAETLLRNPHSMSRADRELIATYVSALNESKFCYSTHREVSGAQYDEGRLLVDKVMNDPDSAPIPEKLKKLLKIAGAVQRSGNAVTEELVTDARNAGATDVEIHDTVLIAAAFCMFNRYCDGLGAYTPEDPEAYVGMAEMILNGGYRMCVTGH